MTTPVDNGLSQDTKDALSALGHIAIGSSLFSIRPSMASALLAYMGSLETQRTEARAALTARDSALRACVEHMEWSTMRGRKAHDDANALLEKAGA
jgi:hypothetical protein